MNQPPEQRPDAQDRGNWLQRQWARLAAGRWRDVIIAQVGEGAENVAVGKNIFQINVAGYNIAPLVLVIMLASLVVAGFLLYPVVEPLWNPWQMKGGFKVAVADFGLLQDGRMRPSTLGADLSNSLFTELMDHYEAVRGANSLVDDVTIWHDEMQHDQKNVDFGLVQGATPEARSASAAALAARIGANMVIYGYLTQEEDPQGLVLEFYYRAPYIASEPDAVAGSLRLGRAIASAAPFVDVDDPLPAMRQMQGELATRTGAIFWLTQAMTFDFANNPKQALAILQQAEQTLQSWPAEDGKEILYFFLGRAALFARDFDEALRAGEEAKAINPDFVNAYVLLGITLMDKAQLHFASGRELSEQEALCTSPEDLAQASPTLEDALADAEQAVTYLQQAVAMAPTSFWPEITPYTHLNLGLAERVRGLAYIFDGRYDVAAAALRNGEQELQVALAAFPVQDNPQYYAWAQMGLGLNYRLQAYLAEVDEYLAQNEGQAEAVQEHRSRQVAMLKKTVAAYQACVDQRDSADAYPVFEAKVLGCSCEPYLDNAAGALAELERPGGSP